MANQSESDNPGLTPEHIVELIETANTPLKEQMEENDRQIVKQMGENQKQILDHLTRHQATIDNRINEVVERVDSRLADQDVRSAEQIHRLEELVAGLGTGLGAVSDRVNNLDKGVTATAASPLIRNPAGLFQAARAELEKKGQAWRQNPERKLFQQPAQEQKK